MTVTHPLGMSGRIHQEKLGVCDLRIRVDLVTAAILLSIAAAFQANAETCFAPAPPFVPSDPAAAREYEELIRTDFELYI